MSNKKFSLISGLVILIISIFFITYFYFAELSKKDRVEYAQLMEKLENDQTLSPEEWKRLGELSFGTKMRKIREDSKDIDKMKKNYIATMEALRKNEQEQGGETKREEILSKYDPEYGYLKGKMRESSAANSLKMIALALEMYKLDNEHYPQTLEDLKTPGRLFRGTAEPYMEADNYIDGYSYEYTLNKIGFIIQAFPTNEPDSKNKKLFIDETKMVRRGSMQGKKF